MRVGWYVDRIRRGDRKVIAKGLGLLAFGIVADRLGLLPIVVAFAILAVTVRLAWSVLWR